MCGISGIVDLTYQGRKQHFSVIESMTKNQHHRGPDSFAHFYDENFVFGFTRLSIIDLSGGMQPITNEDESIVVICNGEIFNYKELSKELLEKGHKFKTKSDVEVIIHLYEEYGAGLLDHLNGQFAFALFDMKNRQLLCARDHFGIIPFHYTIVNKYLVFSSEIKSILEFPEYKKEVDMTGLDQVFSFPGLISPRTAFKNIKSLKNGHYLKYDGVAVKEQEYWDLVFPTETDQTGSKSECEYIEQLDELIDNSINLRLRSDVPVGLYLSGGLDSSLIAHKAKQKSPESVNNAYSIIFNEKGINEEKYQKIVANQLGLNHFQILFNYADITEHLQQVIYFCECPIKETYNAASKVLSQLVHNHDHRVILSGEGADELFAGYVGHKFDKIRQFQPSDTIINSASESQVRNEIWGDETFFYEKNQHDFMSVKRGLYSDSLNERFDQFNSLKSFIVNKDRLKNRAPLHQRSYLDYKLRLVDHLVADHGDRMALANSVEVRYPFLDKNIAKFAVNLPPDLKLNGFEEKYIVKKVAEKTVSPEIINREKFGFVAPGSPYILKRNIEYINDTLAYDTIKRQGYFNPDAVQKLVKEYTKDDFLLNIPFDSDLLIIVITFGILLDKFDLPNFS